MKDIWVDSIKQAKHSYLYDITEGEESKKLYNKTILKIQIEAKKRTKRFINEDNKYKRIMDIKRNEFIKNNTRITYMDNTEQAIRFLISQDFRKLFDFDCQLKQEFKSDIECLSTLVTVAVRASEKSDIEKKYTTEQGWVEVGSYSKKFGREIYQFQKKHDYAMAYIDYVRNDDAYYYFTKDLITDTKYQRRYSIIDLYEIVMGIDYYKAIQQLCILYGLKIKSVETELDKYEHNCRVINSHTLRTDYAPMYKFLGRGTIEQLNIIINIAKERVLKGDIDKEPGVIPIFYKDLTDRIYNKFSKSLNDKSISRTLGVFLGLGLIEQVSINQKVGGNTRYYRIPKYNDTLLQLATLECIALRENNITLSTYAKYKNT